MPALLRPRLSGRITVAGDAEIIPIGTRGKPGRGTGSSKPSSSARSLAPRTARKVQPDPAPASPRSEDDARETVRMPEPRIPVAEAVSAPPAEARDHKHPTAGIPAVDWI